MAYHSLDNDDLALIAAAQDVLRRNYRKGRHNVGAAVRGPSGRIYTGVNVEACGYGPCAEPIAIGAAFSNGEPLIVAMVAVHKRGDTYPVIPPCGNCRQLLFDYAPDAIVILPDGEGNTKTTVKELLPGAYRMFDD
jgi:cytidine deaminase